jgi:hypothetical protein
MAALCALLCHCMIYACHVANNTILDHQCHFVCVSTPCTVSASTQDPFKPAKGATAKAWCLLNIFVEASLSLTGARAKAWCLLIHADVSLSRGPGREPGSSSNPRNVQSLSANHASTVRSLLGHRKNRRVTALSWHYDNTGLPSLVIAPRPGIRRCPCWGEQ